MAMDVQVMPAGNIDYIDMSSNSATGAMANQYVGDDMQVDSSAIGSHIALYITIGVCVVLGLVLGIIFGRKAAYK